MVCKELSKAKPCGITTGADVASSDGGNSFLAAPFVEPSDKNEIKFVSNAEN